MIYMFEISERKYVKQSYLANTKNLHVYLYLSFNFERILKSFKDFHKNFIHYLNHDNNFGLYRILNIDT